MDKKPEKTLAELKHDAAMLQKEVDSFDGQMKKLSAQRAEVNKQLRSVMGKIVTIELKGKQ